jgi:hypothetical protein
VVEKFILRGDYTQGAARIQRTNPDCKYEYFRPFSCKSFYFCPSCSQKRTLLFSEYMNERLLLALPHRQFVFTFPEHLRSYFRQDVDIAREPGGRRLHIRLLLLPKSLQQRNTHPGVCQDSIRRFLKA